MERYYSNLINAHVYQEDSLRPLTSVRDLVIDPESGKLVGILVNTGQNKIIVPGDVLSWGDRVLINNSEAIIDAEEVLRVDNVLKSGIKIIGNIVETEEGERLGRVVDYSLERAGLCLNKIHVAKSILGLFRYGGRILPAKNIVEILPEKIVVKNIAATVKKEDAVVREEMPVG